MYMQGLTEAERKKPMNLAGIGGKAITEEVSLALDPERPGVFNRQQREERSPRKRNIILKICVILPIL